MLIAELEWDPLYICPLGSKHLLLMCDTKRCLQLLKFLLRRNATSLLEMIMTSDLGRCLSLALSSSMLVLDWPVKMISNSALIRISEGSLRIDPGIQTKDVCPSHRVNIHTMVNAWPMSKIYFTPMAFSHFGLFGSSLIVCIHSKTLTLSAELLTACLPGDLSFCMSKDITVRDH